MGSNGGGGSLGAGEEAGGGGLGLPTGEEPPWSIWTASLMTRVPLREPYTLALKSEIPAAFATWCTKWLTRRPKPVA